MNERRREQRVGDFLIEVVSKGLEKAQTYASSLKEFLVYPFPLTKRLYQDVNHGLPPGWRYGALMIPLSTLGTGVMAGLASGRVINGIGAAACVYLSVCAFSALSKEAEKI